MPISAQAQPHGGRAGVDAAVDVEVRVDVPRFESRGQAGTPAAQAPASDPATWETPPRHERSASTERRAAPQMPLLSIGLGLGIGAERWVLGEPTRSGVAGPELVLKLRLGERDQLTLRTGSRQLGVGFGETLIPVAVGWMRSSASSGTGFLYLGGDLRAMIDLGENRDTAIDWGATARVGLAGHLPELHLGVYAELYGTVRASFVDQALGFGGGMSVGVSGDIYGGS